ncbi:hypothetical protein CC78DRAFT_578237 [Lojkania enalia]|uniref:F-box domain-containing protein n=1 Tax=Lojkania enalia TaxID=147567 RepID=A0A9P4KC46_9PLEO|nr:hypothetical protein CC78DRAFT_578237 [Didymosphaeria enalia]
MARITDLPNELLITICQILLPTDHKALQALFLVCRALGNSASTVLSEHLCLPWKLNLDCGLVKYISQTSSPETIRSLRILPKKALMNAFSIRMGAAYAHLNPLCSFLSSLPRLRTFCINLSGQNSHNRMFPGQAIDRILKDLPDSVVNLELDTEGAEGLQLQSDIQCAHICVSISKLLLRLESLRLRTFSMCPDLFAVLQRPESTSQLQVAVIKLQLLQDSRYCSTTVSHCRGSMRLSNGEPFTGDLNPNKLQPDELFNPLLHLGVAAKFPRLRRFLVLSQHGDGIVRIREVSTRTIMDFPFKRAHHCPLENHMVTRMLDLNYEAGNGQMFMIRDRDGLDYYGTHAEMEAALEASLAWEEMSNCSRLPPKIPSKEDRYKLDVSRLFPVEKLKRMMEERIQSGEFKEMKDAYWRMDRFEDHERAILWFRDS